MALFRRKKDPQATIRRALGDAKLPTFKRTVMQALAVVRSERSSLSDVANAIAADPGSSSRLITLANSSAMSRRHPARSLEQAVRVLGRSNVECTLLTISMCDALPKAVKGFDNEWFWRYAAHRAATAQSLAEVVAPAQRSACFTAALLQDMAQPLLAERCPGYVELVAEWQENTLPLAERETQSFGWNHAEIADALCAKWEFPDLLRSAIAEHHELGVANDNTMSAALVCSHLPNQLDEDDLGSFLVVAGEVLGLGENQLEDIAGQGRETGDTIASQLMSN